MDNKITRRQILKAGAFTAAGATFTGWTNFLNCASPESSNAVASNMVWLDQNENPFGISEKAKQAAIDAIPLSTRYSDGHIKEFEKIVAESAGLKAENAVASAGATEIFRTASLLFCSDGKETVLADPSYFGFVNYTDAVKGKMVKVPLDTQYKHDLDAIASKVTNNTNMVYICNPNNPTGTIVSGDELRQFCIEMSKKCVVFVDEAYHDFVEDPSYSSMTDLVKEGHNIMIARTFSKIHGFAGLRVGFALAKKELIEEYKRIRTNFASISILSLKAAEASWKDKEYQKFCFNKNKEGKEFLYNLLKEKDYEYIPSHTNFVLFKIDKDAEKYVEDMVKKGVKIRPIVAHGQNYCRVSIGTPEEMQKLASVLI